MTNWNANWNGINWNNSINWNNGFKLAPDVEARVRAIFLEMMDEDDPDRRLELFDEMADVIAGRRHDAAIPG